MHPVDKIAPIGRVRQNNAMPWLPPIKTRSDAEPAAAGDKASRASMQTGTQLLVDAAPLGSTAAISPALKQVRGLEQMALAQEQAALAFAAQGAFNLPQMMEHGAADGLSQLHTAMQDRAMSALPGSEPSVVMLLQMLQREREQLKNQAMHNEFLMQTVLSTAATAPAARKPFAPQHADSSIWMQMTAGAEAYSAPAVASSVDYTSDDSVASAGKRSHRESSPDDSELAARKKRLYVKSACDACRSSHIACDESQPCRNCMRSGSQCQRTVQVKVYVPPSIDTKGDASAGGAIHEDAARANELALLGRKYVKAACTCCRRSHLACDNYRPCRNCVRMSLQCEEVRSQRRPNSQDWSGRRRTTGPGDVLKELVSAA